MRDFFGFKEHLKNEKQFSSHTIQAYINDLSSLKSHIDDNYDDLELNEIDHYQVRSWIADLSAQGLMHKSINRKLSTLKTFYKYLIKIGEIDYSPMQKLKSLKTPKNISTPFSESEIIAAMESLEATDFVSSRNKLIIELLYATGMRRAELISIQTKDVDLYQKQIKITGKRNKQRIIPLYGSICHRIEDYLKHKNESNLVNKALFVTEKDNTLYPSLIYKIVNSLFSRFSNKSKTSPHILRHTFATHLLNKGASLNAIKELLGHESLSSTEIYTQNSIEQLKQSYHKNHPREAE